MIKIAQKAMIALLTLSITFWVNYGFAQANQTGCGSGIIQPTFEVRVNSGNAFMPLGTLNGPGVGLANQTLLMPNPQFSSVINVNGRTINNICLSQRIPNNNSFSVSQLLITVTNQCVCANPAPTFTYEVWSDNPTWMFGPVLNARVPRYFFTAANTNPYNIHLWPNTQSGSVFIKTTRVADGTYSCDSRIDEIHINRPLDSRNLPAGTNNVAYGHRFNQIVLNTSPNAYMNLAIGNINGGALNSGSPITIGTEAIDIYLTGPDYRSIGNTYVDWRFNNQTANAVGFGVPNPNSPFISFQTNGTAIPPGMILTASAMGCPINPAPGGGLQGPFVPTNPPGPDNNILSIPFGTTTGVQLLRTQQGNIKEQGLSDEGDISINPNPASKNTTIKLPENKKNAQITVVDSKGSVIMKATALTQNTVLNTSALASGTYSVIIRDKNSEYTTKKLIIAN